MSENISEKDISNTPPPPNRSRKSRRTPESRAGITFPISRVHKLFREGNYLTRYRVSASIYVAAVLEHVTCEILELAGWETLGSNRKKITPTDVRGAIKNDTDLKELLGRSGSHLINAGHVEARTKPVKPQEMVDSQPSSSFVPTYLRSKRRNR